MMSATSSASVLALPLPVEGEGESVLLEKIEVENNNGCVFVVFVDNGMGWEEVCRELLLGMRTGQTQTQRSQRTANASPSPSTPAHNDHLEHRDVTVTPAHLLSQLRVKEDGRLAVDVGSPLQVALSKQRLVWMQPPSFSPSSSSSSSPTRNGRDHGHVPISHSMTVGEGEVGSGNDSGSEGGNRDGNGQVMAAATTRSEQQIHERTLAELSHRIEWLQQQPRCAEVLCQQLYTQLCLQTQHGESILAQLHLQSPSQHSVAAAASPSVSGPRTPSISRSSPHSNLASPLVPPFILSPQEGVTRTVQPAPAASPSASSSSPLGNDMSDHLLELVHSLKFYLDRDQNKQEEAHTLLHSIERRLHQQPLPLQALLADTEKLQSLLIPFDVHELGLLLAEQEGCIKQLNGEEVVMLIGFTGCGKSTTIHWLAGSTMEKWTESNGKPHVGPTHVINPAAQDVLSSSTSKSITRFLKAVPVNAKALGGVSDKTLVLVDAPGLMDSRNAETDCANGIGIVDAMQHCGSVRPLIFIQGADVNHNRGAGVRHLARMLAEMLHNVTDTASMLNFAFTHWSLPGEPHATLPELKQYIESSLRDAYVQSSHDPDKDFLTVLECAWMVAEEGKATVIDPLAPKKQAARFIMELTRRNPIRDPSSAFRFFISAETREKIQRQCDILHKGVRQAIEHNDMLVACFRLKQLAVLKDRCKQGQAETALRESEEHVRSWLQRTFQHAQQRLKTMSNADTWSINDIETMLRDVNLLHQADPLAEIIGEKDHARPQALMQGIVKLVSEEGSVRNALLSKDADGMERALQLLSNSLLLKDSFSTDVDASFQPYVDQISACYSSAVSELVSVIRSWLYELATAASHLDLESFISAASQLNRTMQRAAVHLPNKETEEMSVAVDHSKAALLDTLRRRIKESEAWLSSIQQESQLTQLVELGKLLVSASESPSFHMHIDRDAITSILHLFQQRCVSCFNTLVKSVHTAIDGAVHSAAPGDASLQPQRECEREQNNATAVSNVHALDKMGPLVVEMQQLQKIPTIDVLVTKDYHACAQRVLAVVRDARRDAEELLAALSKPLSSSSSVQSSAVYERFVRSVHVLQQATWVESLEVDARAHVLDEIFHGVGQHVQMVCTRVSKLDLSVEHGKLHTALDVRAQVLMMRPLGDLISGFAQQYDAMMQGFEAGAKQALNKIGQTFSLRNVSVGTVQERLAYLDRLRSEYEECHPAALYLAVHKMEDEDQLRRDIADAKTALDAHGTNVSKEKEALHQEIDSLYELQKRLVEIRKECSRKQNTEKVSSSWGMEVMKGAVAATRNAFSGAHSPLDQRIHAALQEFNLESESALKQRLETFNAKSEQLEQEAGIKASQLFERLQELESMLQHYEGLKHTDQPSERQLSLLQQSGHETLKRLESDIEETQHRLDEFESKGIKYALQSRVDLAFAERGLEYMDALRNAGTGELCEWLGDLPESTKEFLLHYRDAHLRDEMRHNYEHVIAPEAQDGSYRHVFSMAQQVMMHVKEIQFVQACHHLSQLLRPQELMAWFVDKLNEQLEHMQTHMEQLASQKRTPELELQLTIAKSLVQFDSIHKRTDVTFAALHQQHRLHLLDNNKTALATALNAIEKHNFSRIRAELNSVSGNIIKGQADYVLEQVRHPLSTSLQHLMTDLRSKIAVLMIPMSHQTNSIQEINTALGVIRRAHTFVLEYLSEETQEELELFVDDECERSANAMLRAKIQEWIDFIRRTIEASNFEQAEEQIKLLQTVCQLLSGNLGNLHESAHHVRHAMQTALDERVKRIAAMSLKELLVEQPMQFLQNLERIAQADGLYRPSLEEVKRAIQKTFKEELKKWSPQNHDEQDEAVGDEDATSDNDCDQLASSSSSSSSQRRSKSVAPARTTQHWSREKKLFRAVLRVLPDSLNSLLQLDLENVEADLKDHWDNSQNEMQTALACNNWTELRQLLLGYKAMGNHELSNKLQDGVRSIAEELKVQIDVTLKDMQSDVIRMFDRLQEYISRLQQIDDELGPHMPMMRAQLSKVQQRVTNAFTSSCTEIRRILQHQGQPETLNPTVCSQLECHTDVFVTFWTSALLAENMSSARHSGTDSSSANGVEGASSCNFRLLQRVVQVDSASMVLDFIRSYLASRAACVKDALTTRPLQVRVLKELLDCARLLDMFYSKLKPLGSQQHIMHTAAAAASACASGSATSTSTDTPTATSHSNSTLADLIEHEDHRYRRIQASTTALLRTMANDVREEAGKDLPDGVELQGVFLQRTYTMLQQHLTTLGEVNLLREHVELPEEDQLSTLTKLINARLNTVIQAACRLESKDNLALADYDLLRRSRAFLSSFAKCVSQADIEVKSAVDRLDVTWVKRVERELTKVRSTTSASSLAHALVIAKGMAIQLTWLKPTLDTAIDTFLHNLQDRTKVSASNTISLVAVELEQSQVGATLLEEHSIFQGYFAKLMLKKVEAQDIQYTLHPSNLRGDDIDSEELSLKFTAFDQAYKAAIKKYYFGKDDISMLIHSIRTMAADTGGHKTARMAVKRSRNSCTQTQPPMQTWWTMKLRQVIPQLFGQLFALWSYRRSESLSESERADACLYQPLAPQVVAIFRLLCLDQEPNSPNRGRFRNNIAQVSTGEGKSLINAMVAMILALLGAEVSIACYSSYLSHRDERDFTVMFDELGIKDRIHYGTFEQVCERMVNEDGNVRSSVEKMIMDSAQSTQHSGQACSADSSSSFSALISASTHSRSAHANASLRILVIDEIDVFFNERFYGNLYTPLACLRHPTITNLVKDVWQQTRDRGANRMSLQALKQRSPYQQAIAAFPAHQALVAEALKDMARDALDYKHDYEVRDGVIAYQELDGYSTTATVGYKTTFAAYAEGLASADSYACINLQCGSFSYAEIPLEFDAIVGVSGTLQTLSEPELRIIQDTYSVRKRTVIPSAFGANNRTFAPRGGDVKIENKNDWHNVIVQEIHRGLGDDATDVDKQRCVLVCFEDKNRLEEFKKSAPFQSLANRAQVLVEGLTDDDKARLIYNATCAGAVTLMTRAFGRGTDFKIRDPSLSKRGGAHMIVTFVPESTAEETQLMGRCARQGDHGSFAMVLKDTDLEQIGMTKTDVDDARSQNQMFSVMQAKRNAKFVQQYASRGIFVDNARLEHRRAVEFLQHLRQGDVAAVSRFLLHHNLGTFASTSRTIVLMDATYSMSDLLEQTKLTVQDLFHRAEIVLEEAGLDPKCFELQCAVYRNYNAEHVIQASSWENKAANLRDWINRIRVDGGMGPEAVECGLWHCNQEAEQRDIAQVILIGDAPPQSAAIVNKLRRTCAPRGTSPDTYWLPLVGPVTDWRCALDKLISKNIRVHTLPIGSYPATEFAEIAQLAGGRSEPLDISTPERAQALTDILTESVLHNAGGARGNELVQAYRAKFARSYRQG